MSESFRPQSDEKNRNFVATRNEVFSCLKKTLNAQHSVLKEKVKEVRDNEALDDIDGFIIYLENEENIRIGDKQKMAKILGNHQSSIKEFDPQYSLYDEPTEVILKMIEFDNQEKDKIGSITILNTQICEAITVKDFTKNLKEQGVPNTEIIRLILEANDSGELKLLPQKAVQYQNFIALINESAFSKDKDKIVSKLNNAALDFDSPSAFENFVYEHVFSDASISKATKIKIQERFGIKPIVTGADLKESLVNRNNEVKEHESVAYKLENQLKDIRKNVETLESELSSLKTQILNESDFDTKMKLEHEYDELEEEMNVLKEQEEKLVSDKTLHDEKRPLDEIPLNGSKAKLENGLIKVDLPILGKSLHFPISASPKEISESVNSMLLLNQLSEWDIGGVLFPDEVITDNDIPSKNMLNFSNEILASLGISKNGEIVKKVELENLQRYFLCFVSQKNMELSKDNISNGMEELGLISDNRFNKAKFLEALKFLHVRNSSDEFSFNGLRKYTQ